MKHTNLCDFFRHFEGQPVEIYTDDGRVHCGIDVNAFEGAVRIIDKCGRLQLIEYDHIDTVIEPQMRLRTRCRCECGGERDLDDRYECECEGCGRDEGCRDCDREEFRRY